jgi:hypothetical protein
MIDFDSVSPLRKRPEEPKVAPVPRHPDQTSMFESPVDTTYAVDDSGAAVSITIRFPRTVRQKCSNCGNRRICFYIGLGNVIGSPAMCARCFGIR